MAKKNSMAYYAGQLRKQGQRRIERLQQAIKDSTITKSTRQWAREQIKEIRSAIQGTRMYSKEGKRYKSKTDKYIGQQMSRLARAISEVEPRYVAKDDPFERSFWMTQHQLNMASVNKPSVYTKEDVKLFYRVTQKIWQRQGVGEHDRNEAILNYYNSIRRENGLSPITLTQLVEYVLNANERVRQIDILDTGEIDSESEEWYEEVSRYDTSDGEYGSPTDVGQSVINAIQDALEDLFILPDPLSI